MLSWRGLAFAFVGPGSSLLLLVILMSVATVLLAFLPWLRSPWHHLLPEQQHLSFLGLIASTLLVGYDTHFHSAALILIPGILVASDIARSSSRDKPMNWILDWLLLGSSVVFAVTTLLLRSPELAWIWASRFLGIILVVTIMLIAIEQLKYGRMVPTDIG